MTCLARLAKFNASSDAVMSRSSRGQGRHPLMVQTPVQIRYGMPALAAPWQGSLQGQPVPAGLKKECADAEARPPPRHGVLARVSGSCGAIAQRESSPLSTGRLRVRAPLAPPRVPAAGGRMDQRKEQFRPRRLARLRTPPFHGGDVGSNPTGLPSARSKAARACPGLQSA